MNTEGKRMISLNLTFVMLFCGFPFINAQLKSVDISFNISEFSDGFHKLRYLNRSRLEDKKQLDDVMLDEVNLFFSCSSQKCQGKNCPFNDSYCDDVGGECLSCADLCKSERTGGFDKNNTGREAKYCRKKCPGYVFLKELKPYQPEPITAPFVQAKENGEYGIVTITIFAVFSVLIVLLIILISITGARLSAISGKPWIKSYVNLLVYRHLRRNDDNENIEGGNNRDQEPDNINERDNLLGENVELQARPINADNHEEENRCQDTTTVKQLVQSNDESSSLMVQAEQPSSEEQEVMTQTEETSEVEHRRRLESRHTSNENQGCSRIVMDRGSHSYDSGYGPYQEQQLLNEKHELMKQDQREGQKYGVVCEEHNGE